MNSVAAKAVRFWLTTAFAAATGCGIIGSAVAAADDEALTHERMSFVNFSDRPVDLFWVDRNDPKRRKEHAEVVRPYDAYIAKTYSGHEFAYEWGDAWSGTVVKATTSMDAQTTEYDPYRIRAQVHVMGDIDSKKVVCGTTKGDIRITVKPKWSPLGAARFLRLLTEDLRYYDGCALNRVVPKFLTQFGIGADRDLRKKFRQDNIADDPVRSPPIPFKHGYMSYAGSGEDSRSTEVFIVMPGTPKSQLEYFGTNSWETPFGYVNPRDLDKVVSLWKSYGDMAPYGAGPNPQKIYKEDGYEYLAREFPEMDYIHGCAIVPDADVHNPAITGLTYEELADRVFGEDQEL